MHASEQKNDTAVWRSAGQVSARLEIVLGFVLTLALTEAMLMVFDAPAALRFAAGGLYAALAIVLVGLGERLPASLGWANRITLFRAVLVITLAGLAAFPDFLAAHIYGFIGTALFALALDGVDGWVARRTGSTSAFGARFDMELDAFFILMLCGVLVSIDKVGSFVVLIGMARYLFVIAQRAAGWLAADLPESLFRKSVCVWQIATLLVCLLPSIGSALASLLAGAALTLLMLSFGRDVLWLYRRG